MNSKTCSDCGEDKPATADYFYRDRTSSDGLHYYCKPCYGDRKRQWRKENPEKAAAKDRRYRLREKYGITPEEYDEMVEDQDGVCAICGEDPSRKNLSVDHDHATGEVRGLLCASCNVAIGHLKDDPELVQAAAEYLKEAP